MSSSKIKDFTQLTIDESKKKNSISYSQYSMYEQCNHRWKLNYIDKHRTFTDSIHTVFGTAMHEVIQVYLHVLSNKARFTKEVKNVEDIIQGIFFLEGLTKFIYVTRDNYSFKKGKNENSNRWK